MQLRWSKHKVSWSSVRALSDPGHLDQGGPRSQLAMPIQKTAQTQSNLDSLLDLHAELPYTTVVEELEEFLYQSELSQA
jgi:hypothetical protein